MDQNLPKQAGHLAECAKEARGQAMLLPKGKLRDALLAKARQYEAQIFEEAEAADLIARRRLRASIRAH